MLTESPQPNLGTADAKALRWRFWLLVLATGALAGLAAGLLMLLLHAVQHLAWGKSASDTFLDAVQAASPQTRLAVLTGAGVLVAVARWLLRRATGGHGAEMAEAIWFKAGRIPFWRTTAQSVLSIVIVGLGASLGREAAPKQMGAAFGSTFAKWAKLSPSHHRLLAAFGAGAGIAAVYNVPFGGALFALEVLLGTLALPLIPPALVASGLATAVAWLFLPTSATYQVAFDPPSPSLLAWAVLFGPVAGLVAAGYIRLIVWADANKPKSTWRLMLSPVVVFAGLGATAILLPQLLGNGKDDAQMAFTTGLSLPLLLALVVLKPLATAACLGSGAPGGLFTPTLTLGAVLGALLGQVWVHVWPAAPAGAFALVGAAAVLAASSQGPVSAVVLVLELTRRLDTLMVPMLLAVSGAVLVGRLLDPRSIYSGRIHRGKAQADEFGNADVVISAAARYTQLLQILLQNAQAARPVCVVDQQGKVIGPVSRTRAQSPTVQDGPLETATAGDFVTVCRDAG